MLASLSEAEGSQVQFALQKGKWVYIRYMCVGGTVPARGGFGDPDFIQKSIQMVLRCNLSLIFQLSGFKPVPPTHV